MEQESYYCGQPISAYSLWELGGILKSMLDAEKRREEASENSKFKKMEFPPTNPEFLKLKSAIEDMIRKKQNA